MADVNIGHTIKFALCPAANVGEMRSKGCQKYKTRGEPSLPSLNPDILKKMELSDKWLEKIKDAVPREFDDAGAMFL